MRSHKKLIIGIVIAAVVIGIIIAAVVIQTGKSKQGESVDVSQAVKTNSVMIKDFAFTPPIISVPVGTTVTWTNKDAIRHSVTADDGSPDMFDSGLIDSKATYTHTFSTKGTFHYHCEPHPYMKGVVIVT